MRCIDLNAERFQAAEVEGEDLPRSLDLPVDRVDGAVPETLEDLDAGAIERGRRLKSLAERHWRSELGQCFLLPFLSPEQLLKLKDDSCYGDIEKEDGGGEAEPPMELPVHLPAANRNRREYSFIMGQGMRFSAELRPDIHNRSNAHISLDWRMGEQESRWRRQRPMRNVARCETNTPDKQRTTAPKPGTNHSQNEKWGPGLPPA